MACIAPHELLSFEHAEADVRAAWDAHLDECADCRALVAAWAQTSDDGEGHFTLAEADPTDPESERSIAQWELVRRIGEGGMGVVWEAKDRTSGERVAVKVLKTDNPEIVARFARESRLVAAVKHPNVVDIRSVVVDPQLGPRAIVMDYLDGTDLAVVLDREGPLAEARVRRIFADVLDAVAAAHALGIVHRDLKPQNVFLARDGEGGPETPMLLDFGLARTLAGSDLAADSLTQTGARLGTPSYMAPEQLYGEKGVDRAADVWALGAMMYECLAGERPVQGKSYGQIVRNVTQKPIAPLRARVPGVSLDLAVLVERMLTLDRSARPSIADAHAVLIERSP
jgi:serine/threonine-protein kinase